jgi:predicted XRE-type DNA-binding protein
MQDESTLNIGGGTMRSANKANKSEVGSGNVFADIGFTNSQEMLVKSELVRHINRIIDGQGLTQVAAAKLLGVSQPRVSALDRRRLTDFSIGRLMRFLVALGHEVDIGVRPASQAGLRVGRPVASSSGSKRRR